MEPIRQARMRDIATAAGVSVVTVSRVINHPEKVARATRERVLKVIGEFDYIPDMVAGSMASRRSYAVGVVVPTITNSLFADTIDGLSGVLEPAGYQLVIGSSRYDPQREAALVRTMLSRRVDSIVLTGTTHLPEIRDLLARSGVPVFEMWNLTERPLDSVIGFSNFDAAREMTRYLRGRGYRCIGYMGGLTENNDRTADREAGFLAAMAEAGDCGAAGRIVRAEFDFRSGSSAILDLRARCPGIDAVFAASDVLAVGAVLECHRQGWRVPQQLAVAGLDDSVIAGQLTPSLTTVRLPRYEIGHTIGSHLLDRLSGRPVAPVRIDLGFEIVPRESA